MIVNGKLCLTINNCLHPLWVTVEVDECTMSVAQGPKIDKDPQEEPVHVWNLSRLLSVYVAPPYLRLFRIHPCVFRYAAGGYQPLLQPT